MKIFLSLLLLTIPIALLVTQPSQADIEACMDTTNYTEDRCIFELSR